MGKKIIMFDYDDTFLVTSELGKYAGENEGKIIKLRLNPAYKTLLCQIDMIICNVLSTALKLGDVYIITNADLGWLTVTAKIFLPNTLKFLSVLPVISANENYRNITTNPMLWKYYTMCDIINKIIEPIDKLISVGDSNMERFAVTSIGYESVGKISPHHIQLPRQILNKPKTVCSLKMYDSPTAKELLSELVYINRFLPFFASQNNLTDIKLTRRNENNNLKYVLPSSIPIPKNIDTVKLASYQI